MKQREELSFNEWFVILVFREFDFLRALGYKAVLVSIHDRDPVVVFENKPLDRRICVSWEGDFLLTIERRKHFLGKEVEKIVHLREYYDQFNFAGGAATVEGSISANASVLKNNFIPLLRGEVWIAEILDQKK